MNYLKHKLALILTALLIFTSLGQAAVTVTYSWPVAGTTAPTLAQSSSKSTVVATVIASADGDTTATITHNLNISAADLARGFPTVTVTPLISQALTALSAWAVTSVTATTVVLTKLTSTGSGNASPQIRVTVTRPASVTK